MVCYDFFVIMLFLLTGPTERKFLHNTEDIVRAGLPFAKVKVNYSDREIAERFLPNKLSFCVEVQKVYQKF